MLHYTSTRRGNALLLTTFLLIIMASLATSLSELAIGNSKLHKERSNQLKTLYAAETTANLGVGHMQNNWKLYSAAFTNAADPMNLRLQMDIGEFLSASAKAGLSDERFSTDRINGFAEEQLFVWLSVITQTVQRADGTSYVSTDPIDWQYKVEAISVFGGTMSTTSTTAASADAFIIKDNDPTALVPVKYSTNIENAEIFRRRRVEIAVYPAYIDNNSEGSIFSNALFALSGYDFRGSATTDSWHSSDSDVDGDGVADGYYLFDKDGISSQSTGNGDLGSNETVEVAKDENVHGNVNNNVDMEVPTFDFDQLLNEMGATSTTISPGTTLSTGAYLTDKLVLSDDALIIEGDVSIFVDGPIEFGKVDLTNGTLTIYQNKYDESEGKTSMNINGNTTVGAIDNLTNPGVDPDTNDILDVSPEKLVFISAHDGDMTLNGNGEFAGVIFAPDMTFKLNGTFNFFGGAITQGFGSNVDHSDKPGQVNGTFNFHYDEALGDSTDLPDPLNNLTPKMVVTGWRSSNLSFNQALN